MKVGKLLGVNDLQEQEQAVPEFCLPRTHIGLEYEWENAGNFPGMEYIGDAPKVAPYLVDMAKYFITHQDGSLRGNGCEFVFKGPYAGSKILRATAAMDDTARALGFSGSYRTSLHCHLDMQDTNFPEDVERLGAVYCLVEPFLYQFVGGNRHTSNYCIPWYKHPQHFENFLTTIARYYRKDQSSIMNRFREHKGDKYAGLNCFAIGQFGTVEFRQAPVTLQRDKIITWINLIMRLKEWSQANISLTPVAVLDYVNRVGARSFLTDVFKTQYNDAVRLSRNVDVDFINGVETLYQYVAYQ